MLGNVMRSSSIMIVVTVLLLVVTVAAPVLDASAYEVCVTVTGALALAALAVVGHRHHVTWGVIPRWRTRHRRASHPLARPVLELALHLSPVLLLTLAFPVATSRIADVHVGGEHLTSLLLASSLTVPWLSQAVCLPLYRAIGHLMQDRDMERIQQRLCQVWPAAFVQTLPAVVLFAVPVELVMRWSPGAFGAYLVLCVVHMAFAQSLIAANVGRRRWHWAAAWAVYAAVLLAAPQLWFLPALAGLATQLVPLRRHLAAMRHPVVLDGVDVATDVLRGLLLGAVLWSDKLFFFLRAGGTTGFAVSTVFVALLPAVLAYNYYFVRLAPAFDRSVLDLRAAMEGGTYGRLAERSRALAATVDTTLRRTAITGAALGLVVTLVVFEEARSQVPLVAWVSVASWLFMMTTVACYKLDYIGRSVQAQVIGAVHLVVCAAVFSLLRPGADGYAVLAAVEVPLCLLALRACRANWRASEYTLFWRHATAW